MAVYVFRSRFSFAEDEQCLESGIIYQNAPSSRNTSIVIFFTVKCRIFKGAELHAMLFSACVNAYIDNKKSIAFVKPPT